MSRPSGNSVPVDQPDRRVDQSRADEPLPSPEPEHEGRSPKPKRRKPRREPEPEVAPSEHLPEVDEPKEAATEQSADASPKASPTKQKRARKPALPKADAPADEPATESAQRHDSVAAEAAEDGGPGTAPSTAEATSIRTAFVDAAHVMGIHVTPLKGKKPLQGGWNSLPSPTLDQARVWAKAGNIGVRCGTVSGGLVVIDIDPGADPEWAKSLPVTVTVLTGRTDPKTGERGRHLYFRSEAAIGNSASKLAPKVDVRGDGGQVVAPGSVHPDTGLHL